MTLAADAPPGVYELKVAVYDPAGGGALPVYGRGRALPVGGLLPLWEIRVREPSGLRGDCLRFRRTSVLERRYVLRDTLSILTGYSRGMF
jgi:hypothetical protein